MSAKMREAIAPPADILQGTFGVAAVKQEGASIPVDPSAKRGKKPPASDWMELCIPRKASRAQVYAMVDRWLNSGRGRKS